MRFSEALGSGASGPTAASFDRQAGKVDEVEDLGAGVWRVKVQPGSWRDVTVGLTGSRHCGSVGVVCTADGRALENSITERGMSLSFGWDPTPSNPLGLTARIAPSWGGSAQGGAEALWGGQMAYGAGSHQMFGTGDRVDAEVDYGLPVGTRFVRTPRVGLTTSEYGRDYRVGYGLGVLDRGDVNLELGVDAQRREMPMYGEASNGFMGRGTLGW